MCRVLHVSCSGYYAWRRRPPRSGESDAALVVEIKAAHAASKRRYGSPRVFKDLHNRGIRCSQKRVARLMREHALWARRRRRFKATTDSNHPFPLAENVLNREFAVDVPDARWAADITYIWTNQGWLYLAVVMDLCSRRIVGWAMRDRIDRSLVIAALEMALAARRPPPGLLHHSDRGSQYASAGYRERLQQASCICSMSRKGNCWDNAPVESFFSTLKMELIHESRYKTHDQARTEIFEFIEVWYNRRRLHSALGYVSPADYEAKINAPTVPLAA